VTCWSIRGSGRCHSRSTRGASRWGAATRAEAWARPTFHRPPSNLSLDDFTIIANKISVTNGGYIYGRVNINTASATVLACLPGINGDLSLAQTLVSYRQTNPDKLGSVAWVVEALGTGNTEALNALMAQDCITTQSYQYTADIAAIGPHGRGYRRARFHPASPS